MLYLWMWYPKYAQAAARCLGATVGLGLGCTPPSENNDEDQFLLKEFNACKDNIIKLWDQFEMTTGEQDEIMRMSRTNCTTFSVADMATTFPSLHKFFFLKYDGLCLANHYQEGLFSSKNTTMRQNFSSDRLDNQMHLKHNDLYAFRGDRVTAANAELASKGRITKYRSAITTRAQCVQAGMQYLNYANTELVPANFTHPDCPTSRSTQRVRNKQVVTPCPITSFTFTRLIQRTTHTPFKPHIGHCKPTSARRGDRGHLRDLGRQYRSPR